VSDIRKDNGQFEALGVKDRKFTFMQRVDKILSIIKWNNSNAIISRDLERAFTMMYSKKYSEGQMLYAWNEAAKKNPFVTYCVFSKFDELHKVRDRDEIKRIIVEVCNDEISIDSKKISDIISLSPFIEIKSEVLFSRITGSDAQIETICIETLKNIELLGNRNTNILRMIKVLYEHVENDILEGVLSKNRYSLVMLNQIDLIDGLIKQMIYDGAFVLAYLVKKAYNFNFRDLSISDDTFYNSLANSNDRNFFRGALIYREFLGADKSSEELKKWYTKVSDIDTSIAKDERNGLDFMYLCWMLQIGDSDPDTLLGGFESRINEFYKIEMNRKQFIREYRKTIYFLLLRKEICLCYRLLKETNSINIDKYYASYDSRWPSEVRAHIGNYDVDRLIGILCMNDIDENVLVYIYMNSFLRGIIGFIKFISCLYETHNSLSADIFKDYVIGGTITYDKNRKVNCFHPNTIITNKYDKMYIFGSSNKLIEKHLNDFDYGIRWFQTKLHSYNQKTNTLKFDIVDNENVELDTIIQDLRDYSSISGFSEKIEENMRVTNIGLINHDSPEFIDLCIEILVTMLRCAHDKNLLLDFIRKTRNINYYLYNFKKNSGRERSIDMIEWEQRYRIYDCWDEMQNISLNVDDAFLIYRNSILRRIYCLSEFIECYLGETKESVNAFLNKIGLLTGRIQTFSRSNEDEDSMILLVAPSEFYLRNRNTKSYDRYIIDIPLYGESATSVRNQKGIRQNTPITFEIDNYYGQGRFEVKNIRILSF